MRRPGGRKKRINHQDTKGTEPRYSRTGILPVIMHVSGRKVGAVREPPFTSVAFPSATWVRGNVGQAFQPAVIVRLRLGRLESLPHKSNEAVLNT